MSEINNIVSFEDFRRKKTEAKGYPTSPRAASEPVGIGIMRTHPKARGRTIAADPNVNRDQLRLMPDLSQYSDKKLAEVLYWCGENEHQFAFATVFDSLPEDRSLALEMTMRLRKALIRLGNKYGNESVRNLWCVIVFQSAEKLEWKMETGGKGYYLYIPTQASIEDIETSIEQKMVELDVIVDDPASKKPA